MMMSATQESDSAPGPSSIPRLAVVPAQFRVRIRGGIAGDRGHLDDAGLGQVYVGYYQRGFVHAVVVASLNHDSRLGTLERLILSDGS